MFVKEVADSVMAFIVSHICSVSYVPYIAGNPMPSRVVGSWRGNSAMKKNDIFGQYGTE